MTRERERESLARAEADRLAAELQARQQQAEINAFARAQKKLDDDARKEELAHIMEMALQKRVRAIEGARRLKVSKLAVVHARSYE